MAALVHFTFSLSISRRLGGIGSNTGHSKNSRRGLGAHRAVAHGLSSNIHVTPSPAAWRISSTFKEGADDVQEELKEAPQAWPYLKPLLLAFFASQRRSVFATSSMVRTAMEMYLQGLPWSDFELELKLAGMQEGQKIGELPEEDQAKARLMVDLEKDVLLQWIGLIYLTLEEMGVQKVSCGSLVGENSQIALGMRWFVKQTLGLGFDSQRLHLQQRMVEEEGGVAPASVKLMQENARLIVLTKEVVLSQSSSPLENAREATADTCGNLVIQQGESALVGQAVRPTAARILLAFQGAANGSQYSVNVFLEELLRCYRQGWAAHEIFGALSPQEFESGQTLFPVAALEGSGKTNADMLANWISAVYITLVQVGVPPGGTRRDPGWAWAAPVGVDDAVAASRLSQFVAGTLQNQAEAEGKPPPEDSAALAAVKGLPKTSKLPRPGQGYVFLEDPSVRQTSSAIAVMSQLVTLIQLTRQSALGSADVGQGGR